MKHYIKFCLTLIVITNSAFAQQYVSKPGLDKFVGIWQNVNGTDTITLHINQRYIGSSTYQVKHILGYYKYKSGNTIIRDNLNNLQVNASADFVGSMPYGASLDSIKFFGTDKLKRKRENGILTINSSATQIVYTRNLEIGGGGLNVHPSGEGPLPGYTLPSVITFTKVEIPIVEMRRPS